MTQLCIKADKNNSLLLQITEDKIISHFQLFKNCRPKYSNSKCLCSVVINYEFIMTFFKKFTEHRQRRRTKTTKI